MLLRHVKHGAAMRAGGRLRRSIRFDHWWWFKIPPMLSVAAAVLLGRPELPAESMLLVLTGLWSVCCVASYGHLINDLFDVEQDRLAKKPNAMDDISFPAGLLQCGAAAACGFAPMAFAQAPRIAWLLLGLNYALPTLYSTPPFRLKERGVLGLLSDALAAHVIPTLFIVTVLSASDALRAEDHLLFVVAFVGCAFIAGIKGILGHQLDDREADVAAGVRTLVANTGAHRAGSVRTQLSLFVELPAVSALVFLLAESCPLAPLALGLYLVVESLKWSFGWRCHVDHSRKASVPNVPFANNAFHEAWLPAAMCLQLGLRFPNWGWMGLVPFALFSRTYLRVARDTWGVVRVAWSRIESGYRIARGYGSRLYHRVRGHLVAWRSAAAGLRERVGHRVRVWRGYPYLMTSRSAQAHLVSLSRVGRRVRVEIKACGDQMWNVQLIHPLRRVTQATRYRVEWRARSAGPRRAGHGFWQTGAGGKFLGGFKNVDFDPTWRSFDAEFVATSDEGHLGHNLWLGGDLTAVEVEGFRCTTVGRAAAEPKGQAPQ